ncbi:hypothetical protein GRF29_77g1131578 [Pseudopithomyces chartarum]|uniref:D-isomer specific 2-hydroxyacid dehydrogenase NAD-binding domain-containing protein n=1 Tax=Pseudopithomyces chartarum TaxID=1892770 RepID=A0AAN6RH77_9PLEO|nr:hypothetical protein GRF29_77g1131578 [Pseudopithomyces chartarum]
MGGGVITKRGRGLVLLAIIPLPEESVKETLAEIKEEFPDLEYKYIFQQFQSFAGSPVHVPADLLERVNVLVTISWLPQKASDVPNIKFIQFISAGTNHVAKHPIYTDTKIPLCSANGVHGPQIAEWVVMTDLIHNHNYIDLYKKQQRREWKNAGDPISGKDNVGRTVGILGYGSIGRQVARVAKAMGMKVLAYTASPRKTPESKRDNGFIVPGTGDAEGEFPSAWYSGLDKESLHEFLRQKVDLLVLAVPLTKQTLHFLSAPEFALLHESNPSGTYIANIARGQIIDQPALIEALKSKQISGAALDVTDPEPLPADDPLWDAPNVLITPHVSGVTETTPERIFQVIPRQPRAIHGARCKARRMAELVAAGPSSLACHTNSPSPLTNQRQPDELEAHQGHDGEQDPQHGLGIQGNPEEALVGRILVPAALLGALKHPAAVARRGVDLVPPAQSDEAAAGDVLEVVEVGGQQEDGDDEDEDEVGGEEAQAEEVGEEGCCGEGMVSWMELWGRVGEIERERARTDAEEEKGEQGDGVAAESPAQ